MVDGSSRRKALYAQQWSQALARSRSAGALPSNADRGDPSEDPPLHDPSGALKLVLREESRDILLADFPKIWEHETMR